MKRREWRKIRAGEGLAEHPLSKQDLRTAAKNVSPEMVQILRRALSAEELGVPIDGSWLRARSVSTKTIEALVKRALVSVVWAKVPHRAPVDVKVESATVTEKGRAVVAILDIELQERPLISEFTAGGHRWSPPAGVTHVIIEGGGGGGGGAGPVAGMGCGGNGSSQSAQAGVGSCGGSGAGNAVMTAAEVARQINRTAPGVVAVPAGASVRIVAGERGTGTGVPYKAKRRA